MPLSNTTISTLASAPYYDDFDRDKRFHRVAFRPRVPVQTRELNQIQSIAQNQLEQLGAGIFKEGAAVSGGNFTFANSVVVLQVVRDDSTDLANFFNTTTGVGRLARGATSLAEGRVVQVAPQTGETYGGVLVTMLTADTFVGGESVTFTGDDGSASLTLAADPLHTRDGCVFSVDAGVFFLHGHLIDVERQTVVLSSNSAAVSARVGFVVSEVFMTASDDSSLTDPAMGTTNYAAPGAHRLKLTATLTALDVNDPTLDIVENNATTDFIEIARIVDGVLQQPTDRLAPTLIEETLARRTYDESGDYVVRPFRLTVKDHIPSTAVPNATGTVTTNASSTMVTGIGTVFTTEVVAGDRVVVEGQQRTVVSVANNTVMTVDSAFPVSVVSTPFTVISDDYLNLELEAGKAYVRGLEFQTLGTTKLEVPRPRTTASYDNFTIGQFYGPFLYVTPGTRAFDVDTLEKIDLHSVSFADINAASVSSYAASKIGTARARAMVFDSGVGDANSVYKLYLIAPEFQTKTLTVTTGTSNSQLTLVTANSTLGTLVLRQNTATANAFVIASGANAYAGATVLVYDIDNRQVQYVVASSANTTQNSTVREVTLTLGSKAFMNRINTSANVVFVFSDKCIRGAAESNVKAKGVSVHELSKAGADRTGNTILYGTNTTALLFQMPQSWIDPASIIDPSFDGIRTFTPALTTNATHTSVSFSITEGDGSKFAPVQFAYQNFIVSNATSFIPLSASNTTASLSPDNLTATINIWGTGYGANTATLYVQAKVDGIGGNLTKTLYVGNTNLASVNTTGNVINSSVADTANSAGHIGINTINVSSSRVITLGVPDVLRVTKVYAAPNPSNTSTYIDVTSNYTLDNGQRSWCYDHAALVLKPGASHSAAANTLLVIVDRFGHSGSPTINPYFTPKSYVGIDIGDIPNFVDPDSGATIPLRNVIDFRPVRTANVASANVASTTNPYVNSTATFATRTIPDPEGVYMADFSYYLPRIDKVVLTKERQLMVLQGEPSLRPVAPADSSDGMTLYVVSYPPYTADVQNVQIQPIDHRRYTMRDIGRLEKRIDNLEYYVSLSMLEQVTAQQPEYDDNDIERFKNGILVDPFSSHAIGAVDDPDYACAIDEVRQELRASFDSEAFPFGGFLPSSSTGVTVSGNAMVTLSYTVTPFISQPLASKAININPFNVASWNGQVQLTPTSDIWMDTVTLPTVTRNLAGEQDNWEQIGFGTVWGDWRTTWVGQPTVAQESIGVVGMQIGADVARGEMRNQWVNVIQSTESTTRGTSRTGTNITAKASTITTDLGDRIVDISVVPFMRAQEVQVVGTGLLPGATLHATFDGVDVTNYVDRANELTVANSAIAATFHVGERVTSGSAAATVAAISGNVLRLVDAEGNFVDGATVNGATSGASTTSSGYVSHHGVVVAGSGTSVSSVTLDASATAANLPIDGYVGKTLFITSGAAVGQRAVITAYDSGTRIATLSPALTPATNYSPTGAASASGATSLVGSTYSIGSLQADNLSTIAGDATRVPGTFVGLFRLPSGTFNTGRRIFKLSDSTDAAASKTFAEGMYEATGQTKTVERTIVSTRNVSFDTKRVSETSTVTTSGSPSLVLVPSGNYIDPLAQTFLVDPRKYPSGIFLHSVDLFFAQTDPSGLPVVVQIRPTVNGYPSADAVLPFAEAVVSPNELQKTAGAVSTTRPTINEIDITAVTPNPDTAGHATRFTFPGLVYLAPGTEYAIVVLTNSFKYEVCVGEIGKRILNSERVIAEQPYAGSFFKSQNARTWTAEQWEDLMFVLNRAEFVPSGTAMFQLGATPTANVEVDLVHIETGHIDFDATSPSTSHAFGIRNAAANTVTVLGVRTGEDIDLSAGDFGERKLIAANERFSAKLQSTMGTTDTAVSPVYDLERMSLITTKNKIDNGGLYAGGFVIKNPGVINPIGTTSFPLTFSGGNGTGAAATATVNATSGFVESVSVITAGSGYTETPTITWAQAFSTQPVIEYRGETSPKCEIDGEEKARYITRRVSLADGFDASDLKVYFTANRPSGTNIEVYYKVLATGDPETFDQKPWVRMLPRVGQEQNYAAHAQHFREYEFRTADSTASYTANGNLFDRFHTFAIKVVMRTEDPTIVPRLRNLRVIALDE